MVKRGLQVVKGCSRALLRIDSCAFAAGRACVVCVSVLNAVLCVCVN